MDKEIIKKKSDIMKSIMTNPQLAKTFKEAMAAPIGSTKREQAKSVLSIMKKVGGVKRDGQGGPLDTFGSISSPSSALTVNSGTNFSNIYAIPAAPALKNFSLPTTQTKDSGLSSVGTNTNTQYSLAGTPLSSNIFGNITTPATYGNLSSTLSKDVGSLSFGTPKVFTSLSGLTTAPPKTIKVPSGLTGAYAEITNPAYTEWETNQKIQSKTAPTAPATPTTTLKRGDTGDAVAALQKELVAGGFLDASALENGGLGIYGPLTEAAVAKKALASQPGATGTQQKGSSVSADIFDKISNSTNKSDATRSFVANIAAASVAKILGYTPQTPLSQVPVIELAKAIATNEGYFNGTSTPAIMNNNPGNLKFANQPGATQGTAAADGGYFAKFATPEEGAQALINDLQAKYSSGKYQTINDLMSVYSPDSGNPSAGGTAETTSDAQKYIDAGLGSVAYGQDVANAAFGGDFNAYVLDVKNKAEAALKPLEAELNNLKAQGTNLVPTLQTWMKGKDQYLQFIDKMIENSKDQLAHLDIGDPAVAKEYQENLNYLYTLKGRQNTRYANYLNAAIADYNADVTKAQSNYETVAKQINDALTSQLTIDQNTYNNLYTRAAAAYTELDNSWEKNANRLLIQKQMTDAGISVTGDVIEAATTLDPKFLEKVADYTKQFTIQGGVSDHLTGTLDMDKVGPEGLVSIYKQNYINQGNQEAMTEALRIALTKTLNTSSDPKTVSTVKKMIETLANAGFSDSAEWAQALSSVYSSADSAAQTTLSKYILGNIGDIKKAANDLISGGWFGKSGIEDKAGWMKKHSNLGNEFLESLYTAVITNINSDPAYASNPKAFINQLFGQSTDEDNARTLASVIAVSS